MDINLKTYNTVKYYMRLACSIISPLSAKPNNEAKTTEVEAYMATYLWFVELWTVNSRLLTMV